MVKGMPRGALSEKYLRKILGAVLAREILMYRHSYPLSLLRISLGFAPLNGGGTMYFRNGRKVILTTLLKLRECSFFPGSHDESVHKNLEPRHKK